MKHIIVILLALTPVSAFSQLQKPFSKSLSAYDLNLKPSDTVFVKDYLNFKFPELKTVWYRISHHIPAKPEFPFCRLVIAGDTINVTNHPCLWQNTRTY